MHTLKLRPLSSFGVEVISLGDDPSGLFKNIRRALVDHSLVVIPNGLKLIQNFFQNPKLGILDIGVNLSQQTGPIQNKVLHWDFGPLMKMSYNPKAQNYLFSDENVPYHWDGAFFKEPKFLLFHCIQTEGSGGQTLFSNTEKIWHDLSLQKHKKLNSIELEFSTKKMAHYGGKIKVKLCQEHPEKKVPILRFAERVATKLNPVKLTIYPKMQQSKSEDIYQELVELIYHPKYMYEHSWNKGDILIADNFSLLHGRKRLGDNITRSFERVQIL